MTALPGFGGGRQSGREYSDKDVPSLHGKIALLTGATAGVSLHVAKVLASKGSRVLLLARREDNPDAALEDIRQHCSEHDHSFTQDPDLAFVECDLANLENVKRVADDLYARAKLAAVLFVKFGLAPRMNAPAPTPCSSDVQARADDSPHMDSDRPRGILALATDPGPVHPGQPAQLAQAYGPLLGSAAKLVTAPFERTPADAARSTLWAATAPELEQDWERWQGAYVTVPGQEDAGCAMARDETRGARLWAMSEDLVRKRLGEDALQPWTWRGDEDEGEAYATPGQGRWLSP